MLTKKFERRSLIQSLAVAVAAFLPIVKRAEAARPVATGKLNAAKMAQNFMVAFHEGTDPANIPCSPKEIGYYGYNDSEVVYDGPMRSRMIARMGAALNIALKNYRVENARIDVVSEEVAFCTLTVCGNLPDGKEVRAVQCNRLEVKDGVLIRNEGHIDWSRYLPVSVEIAKVMKTGFFDRA